MVSAPNRPSVAVRRHAARQARREAFALLLAPVMLLATPHSATPIARPAAFFFAGCDGIPGTWGDVTNDGQVSIVDAQQIARFSVALTVSNPTALSARGDVTADGTVNIIDAQQIARYSVSLPAAPRIATDLSLPAVATIGMSPSGSQTIAPAATLQYSATPRDASGADVSACTAITWTSSNLAVATISTGGLVTAVGAGSTTITARSVSSPTTSTSVTVTVQASGTVLFAETFENTSFTSRGWYDAATALLSTTEKYAGNSAAQFRFTQGAQIPTAGVAMRHKFTPTSSVYLSMYIKYSANWVGSGRLYQPHEFHFISDLDSDYTGPGHTYLTAYIEHNYQSGGKPLLALQDNKSINTSLGTPPVNLTQLTESRSVGGCNGGVEIGFTSSCFPLPGETPPWYNFKQFLAPVTFQPTAGPGYKNNWNFVEVYFQMNTVVAGIGLPNGIMQYWFNGQLIVDRRDVMFRAGARANMRFSQFLIAPYIGDGSPVDQSMYIDNLTVATGR